MKKRYNKIKTLTLISMIITVISAFTSIVLPYIISNIDTLDLASFVDVVANPNSLISVYIAGKSNSYIFPLIFGILSIVGIIYLYVNREKETNNQG